jgi:hypothetical protein
MDTEGDGMTTETEFGKFTQAEVDEMIVRELERERDRLVWPVLIGLAVAYFVGVAAGLLAA